MNHLETYSDIGTYSEVLGASPFRQIQLLLEKLASSVNQASIAMNDKNISKKCQCIVNANDIVSYLRDCLDFSTEDSVAPRLDAIYAHLEKQLFIANSANSQAALDECATIITNIKTWWDNVGAA